MKEVNRSQVTVLHKANQLCSIRTSTVNIYIQITNNQKTIKRFRANKTF